MTVKIKMWISQQTEFGTWNVYHLQWQSPFSSISESDQLENFRLSRLKKIENFTYPLYPDRRIYNVLSVQKQRIHKNTRLYRLQWHPVWFQKWEIASKVSVSHYLVNLLEGITSSYLKPLPIGIGIHNYLFYCYGTTHGP